MPYLTLAQETIAFLQSCLLGVGLAVFYDLLRLFRFAVPCHTVVVFLQDLFYFAGVTFATFCFVLAFHDGKLRAFLLAGELLGAVVYFFTLSLLLLKICKQLITLVKTIFFRLLFAPLRTFFRSIGRLSAILGNKLKNTVKKFIRIAETYLQNRKLLVYNKKTRISMEKERK